MAGNSNSGRGSVTKDQTLVASLAREHSAKAIKKLADLMEKADSEATQLSAATALLDRGWGKSAQAINHGDSEGKNLPPQQNITYINGIEVTKK